MYCKQGYRSHWGHAAKHQCGSSKRKAWAKRYGSGWGYPPVNVQELDQSYELFVYAPGLEKSDFKITVRDIILTIAVEKSATHTEEGPIWLRKEFSPKGFKRRFELNDKIDTTSIKAEYKDGMLQVTLPKKEGHTTTRQEIDVQ